MPWSSIQSPGWQLLLSDCSKSLPQASVLGYSNGYSHLPSSFSPFHPTSSLFLSFKKFSCFIPCMLHEMSTTCICKSCPLWECESHSWFLRVQSQWHLWCLSPTRHAQDRQRLPGPYCPLKWKLWLSNHKADECMCDLWVKYITQPSLHP